MAFEDDTSATKEASIPPFDWEKLRSLSLRAGGFREQRVEIWPRLLNVSSNTLRSHQPSQGSVDIDSENTTPDDAETDQDIEPQCHEDEHQIRLDTERSFVLYPVGDPDIMDKDGKQKKLHDLLVSIFRKRRSLSYFQGYHDIIAVLFLTLPHELQFPCAEKISLHRVRDSMGSSLEPVLGLLRVMKKLLRLADPSFASLLERNSPLPYYALSNLLTLFSHDMPTLTLIQHVFDYLLCRPPIIVVYLATAIVLSRNEEVQWLADEGEDGMVHSLLSGLPNIYEEEHSLRTQNNDLQTLEVESEAISAFGSEGITDDDGSVTGATSDVESEPKSVIHHDVPCPGDNPFPDPPVLPGEDPGEVLVGPPVAFANGDVLQPEVSVLPPPEKIDEKEQWPVSDPTERSHRANVSLSSLLVRADELFALFPPIHPDLFVSSIMGPQSVVFTWSEDPAELPDDDDAEHMATIPALVVYPYVPSEPPSDTEEPSEKQTQKTRRRKLRKPARFVDMVAERRTMVAGAALVLGVAMAVYSIRAKEPGVFGAAHIGKRVSGWLEGALVGVSDRVMDGFGSLL